MAVASERSQVRGGFSSASHGRLLTNSPRSGLQNRRTVAATNSPAKLLDRFGLAGIAEGAAEGRQRVLHSGGGIEIEGALLVALALVGDVVHPDRRNAEVLHRQQAVARRSMPCRYSRKAEQARIRLPQRLQLARVEVMTPAIED